MSGFESTRFASLRMRRRWAVGVSPSYTPGRIAAASSRIVADQFEQSFELVLRQRLGGKQIERAGVRIGERRFQNRQVVAERLAAGGAGDDDEVPPGPRRFERRHLMRIELLDPARREQPHERLGERRSGSANRPARSGSTSTCSSCPA